jgi:P-type conjugative transfer protein TrbJ
VKTIKISSRSLGLFTSIISIAFISGLFLLSNVQNSDAQTVFCSNCGTWWTQGVQEVQQAENQVNTYATQLNSYATMVSNATNIANTEGGQLTKLTAPIQQDISGMQNAYNSIQQLGTQASTIASNIQNLPNIPADAAQNAASIAQSLTGSTTNLLNQIKAALQSNGIQMSTNNGQAIATSLQSALQTASSSSTTGTVNALDATDHILALEVQQLSSLNTTMTQLASIMESYQAQQLASSKLGSETQAAAVQNTLSNANNFIPSSIPPIQLIGNPSNP